MTSHMDLIIVGFRGHPPASAFFLTLYSFLPQSKNAKDLINCLPSLSDAQIPI